MFGLDPHDLTGILQRGRRDFETLRDTHLFLTGGTGFFGKWLLAALDFADAELNLNLRLTVLSRDPHAFFRKYPDAAQRAGWTFLASHVAELSLPAARFDYILHAAADTTSFSNEAAEAERTRALIQGTQRVLDLAQTSGARRLLDISSGAVYGSRAGTRAGAQEDDFADAIPLTPYAAGKRKAEQLCADSGIDFVTARAFAFLGPHLPLDAHFAAGNFLRDALRGGPIEVRGDGTALRSYLYPADLITWLLAILARGQKARAYNVGSDQFVSTAELAHAMAKEVEPSPEVIIQSVQPQGPQNIYLPNLTRARQELGLEINIPLPEAIRRTLAFHRKNRSASISP